MGYSYVGYPIHSYDFPSPLRLHILVQWLARLTAIQEVQISIPGYTLEIFLEVQGLERGPPSPVRAIGYILDMRSSEIRLRKLKLRLRDKRFANHKAPCTAIWQQPLQSVLALRGCSPTYVFLVPYSVTHRYPSQHLLINIIRVFCPRAGPSLQAQEPGLQFCQRQVFHRKLRNTGYSFTRHRIGAVASRCFPHPTLSLASEQTLKDLKRSQVHQRKEGGFR